MIAFLKLTRWIYNTFAGAMTPNQIAWGLCLGLFCALMPMGLVTPQLWAIVLLYFTTRASVWLFMMSVALLKPLMGLGLAALPWKVGRALLENESLRGPLGRFLHAPVVAWFPGDHYAVLGGFVVALAMSIVLFMPIRMAIVWFRSNIQPRADQYRLIRWWRGFFLTRALSYVFVGGSK
jgi:uncharacterized protein (TIGR03546 family)